MADPRLTPTSPVCGDRGCAELYTLKFPANVVFQIDFDCPRSHSYTMSMDEGATPPESVDNILSSSTLAHAIENDRYKQLLDHAPVAVAISRGTGAGQLIAYINKSFEVLLGVAAADVEGKPWSCLDTFHSEDDSSLTLGSAIATGGDFVGVFRPDASAERLVIVQAYASVIENDDGVENFRIAALVDVAGRERAQLEQYETQIRDRDTLLRELQHRVKNNLQLITALIRLEARAATEGESVALARLASRIDALTVLYRTLSAENADANIDLGQYLSDVTASVMQAQASEGIAYEVAVDHCGLSINIAMPVGLLVNEMLTNALKYAFDGRSAGFIKVICHLEGERITVAVSDDGVGIGENVSWPSPRKLGALVLQTLRENARNVEFNVASLPGQGTIFTLAFDQTVIRLN
jgi:two-component sensor histidine kinase